VKRGRPKIAAKDRRGTILRLRLTREEYKALCAAAEKAEVSVSGFARKKLMKDGAK